MGYALEMRFEKKAPSNTPNTQQPAHFILATWAHREGVRDLIHLKFCVASHWLQKNTFWRMPTSGSQYIVEMCFFFPGIGFTSFQVVFKSEFNFTRTQSMLTSQSRLHVVCSNHTTKPVIICFDISSPHIGCNLRVYARWTRSTAGVISSVAESLPRSKKKFALKIELNGCFPLPELIESKSFVNI